MEIMKDTGKWLMAVLPEHIFRALFRVDPRVLSRRRSEKIPFHHDVGYGESDQKLHKYFGLTLAVVLFLPLLVKYVSGSQESPALKELNIYLRKLLITGPWD